MKQKVLRICIMLIAFATLPLMAEAKKIKYGNYVLYDGKAKKGIPTGEGTLTTTCGLFTDMLMGNFVGDGTVTDAQLKFPSGWKFTGTLSYSVEIDGSQVTYTLTDGELYIISASANKAEIRDLTLKITAESPVKLVRTPMPDAIDLKKYEYNTTVPGTLVGDDFAYPLVLKMIGDKTTATANAQCTILPTSKVTGVNGGSDPKKNLAEKDFAGITEPWSFLVNPKAMTMSDGVKITREGQGHTTVTIDYPNQDQLVYWYNQRAKEPGRITQLKKTYADKSALMYIDKPTWIIVNPDQSSFTGDVCLNKDKFVVSASKALADYNLNDVYMNIMKAASVKEFSPKMVAGELVKADGTKSTYRRGHDEAEFEAREKARQKAVEDGTTLILEKLDVTGEWTVKNDKQPFSSISNYTLTIEEDGNASLRLTTDFYSSYGGIDSKPYYVRNVLLAEGKYTLSEDNIVFNWGSSAKKDGGLKPMYGTKDNYPGSVRTKVSRVKGDFGEMLYKLQTVKVSNISDLYITFADAYTFKRLPGNDKGMLEAQKSLNKDNKLDISSNGVVTSFKHVYGDGVVKIENGTMNIDYANGDKYVGTGYFGVITSDGKLTGNSSTSAYDYDKFVAEALNTPDINDVEVLFQNGTLTKSNGTTLKFTKGLTDKQNNQIDKNMESLVNMVNELAAKELESKRQKSAATKKQLLSEGFPAYYVNSIFDNYRILQGTPKSLIDRALQLGCHIQKYPGSVSDAHISDIRYSGETYCIVITNLQTGGDAFEGFVKFHWASHRVIYVGHQIR